MPGADRLNKSELHFRNNKSYVFELLLVPVSVGEPICLFYCK